MLISGAWVFAYCSSATLSLTAIQEKYQDQNFCIPLCISVSKVINSAGIYNKNTRRMCEIELRKTSEQMTTSLTDFTKKLSIAVFEQVNMPTGKAFKGPSYISEILESSLKKYKVELFW